MPTVTRQTYELLDQAFDFFNRELFAGILPPVAITLHRKRSAMGYHMTNAFKHRQSDEHVSEIAINPDHLLRRDDKVTLSTLVHEMCHEWQHLHGKPGRGNYHNREFANQMRHCGLQCSQTGAPGGAETGQGMTHYVIPGGPFDLAFQRFTDGRKLEWGSVDYGSTREHPISKVKYTCQRCSAKAWAKPGTLLLCGQCHEDMIGEDEEE